MENEYYHSYAPFYTWEKEGIKIKLFDHNPLGRKIQPIGKTLSKPSYTVLICTYFEQQQFY